MSNKNYKLIKTVPNEVLFFLHPVSNMALSRRIYLNSRTTQVALPEDWALGVFQDEEVYNLYKSGAFTFDDNECITKAAFEAGVYFDESLEFEPATTNQEQESLDILLNGNRAAIMDLIKKRGEIFVRELAGEHAGELTQAVRGLLETVLKTQLVPDGTSLEEE